MPIIDPPEPPEGGTMRAKDLVNKVCIFHPVSLGEWPAKAATESEKAMKAQPFVACDVWVLDRAGITEEGTEVRVGWWKAVEQLKTAMGAYMAAKPKTEEGSNAIYLAPLSGEAREVAAKIVAELENGEPDRVPTPPAYEDGEEPF